MNLNQVTLPAFDIVESIAFYEYMGFKKIVENESYARFECPAGDATFSLEKVDAKPSSPGVVIYFEVDDVKDTYKKLTAKGYVFESAPRQEDWLWEEARLRDPSGNTICLYHAGENRKNPPWRIGAMA